MVDSGVKLGPIYGGTEFGGPTYMLRRPEGDSNWEWVSLDERLTIRWDPQGDGTYECQFIVCLSYQWSIFADLIPSTDDPIPPTFGRKYA